MLLPSRMAKNEPDYPLSDRLLASHPPYGITLWFRGNESHYESFLYTWWL